MPSAHWSLLMLGAVMLSGCGSNASCGSGSGAVDVTDVHIGSNSDGSMYMIPHTITAHKCAHVQLIVHNDDSAIFHDLSVIDYDGSTIEHDAEGGQTVVTHHAGHDYFVATTTGSFVVKCQVAGHAARGMQGTLTVR